MKRVLICGDREWWDERPIRELLLSLPRDSLIITGGCRGADRIANEIAESMGFATKVEDAKWDEYANMGIRRAAGPIRNRKMLADFKPDVVYAFHNDIEHSKGTKDMVEISRRKGVLVEIITTNPKVEGEDYMSMF